MYDTDRQTEEMQTERALNEGDMEGLTLDNANDFLKRKQQLREELDFPDEIDTPHDILAKDRFARYRALQSFRSSPWHPKENLPADYAKVYQLESFSGMQRSAMDKGREVEKAQEQNDLVSRRRGSGDGNSQAKSVGTLGKDEAMDNDDNEEDEQGEEEEEEEEEEEDAEEDDDE